MARTVAASKAHEKTEHVQPKVRCAHCIPGQLAIDSTFLSCWHTNRNPKRCTRLTLTGCPLPPQHLLAEETVKNPSGGSQ
jgi:hypothetical protein